MKKLFFAAIAIMAVFATGCSNNEEPVMQSQNIEMVSVSASTNDSTNDNVSTSDNVSTRAVSVKTPKLTTYIETNDINPLNMGEYYFTGTNPKDYVVDHVILFASNIRGTISTVQLYHNPNQTYILNNRSRLVKPLQDKGIKVLLGLLGDHTGVGFANLTGTQITSFANQVADCVEANGLDGVDFDDEYAEYGRISGTPSPNGAIFSQLITTLRANPKMSGKLITAFYYGYAGGFNQAAMNAIDYMWPNFGVSGAPSGFANSKWAKMSIQYTQGIPAPRQIQSTSKAYNGYGAIMMFNIRDYDASATMNYFAPNVWGKRTVSYTGISHPKNY